jgi:hypothetical protein
MKIRVKNLLRVQTAKVEISSYTKINDTCKCGNLLNTKTLAIFRLPTYYLRLFTS